MSSIARRLLPGCFSGLGLLVTALFVQAVVLVMLDRRGVDALGSALRASARSFLPGLVVLLLLGLLRIPLHRLAGASDLIAARGWPELTAVVALADSAGRVGCGFLLTGAITLIHLSVVADREEDGA